jgi:hypothetical protein
MSIFQKSEAAGEDRFEEYSNLSLQQTDEARRVEGVHGPALHIENELDAFGREQVPLFRAEGIVASRDALVEREALRARQWSSAQVTTGDMRVVDAAREHLLNAHIALSPFVRRKSGQKAWFIARTGLLLMGDVVGQASAQIYFGEIPELALIQSAATGVAVVTAGLIGAEVKDLRMSAKRRVDKDSLTEAQKSMSHFFTGEDQGRRYVRILVITAGCVGALISGGIFALRAFVDNPLSGIVYGSIAAGIAIASFVSSYVHADEAGDLIDTAEHVYEKALKRQAILAASVPRAKADEATALHSSIQDEFGARAEAAQITHEGLKHRVLRRNPGIAGHSPAEGPEPIVGSRARSAEDGA